MVTIRKKKIETPQEKEARVLKEKEEAMGIQDEYQAKGFELVSWVQDNKGKVISLILIALFGCGAFSAYLFYQKRASELASMSYLEVLQTINKNAEPDVDMKKSKLEAQNNLKILADSQAKTGVSILANLYAAHLALDSGDSKSAISLYENALARIKKSDDLYSLTMVGLGYAYSLSGESEKAIGNFESVIDIKNASGRDLALYEAARLLSDKKEVEKASGYLVRLIDEYPSSVYEKKAKRLKEMLE